MSTTMRSKGESVTYTNDGSSVPSGTPVAIGRLLAVTENTTTASGQTTPAWITGEHELPKGSSAISLGELVDFDISIGVIEPDTFTTATGDLTDCGICTKAALSGDATVWVKINANIGSVA